MSEEQKNRRKNVRRKKRRLTGASHQGVNQTLVVQIEGEQGENAERRKKTSKKRNVFFWIWDGQFTSLVFSNFLVLFATAVIVTVYASICLALENDKSKRLQIIIDTMIPGALTYFTSVIMQDLVEIARFRNGKLSWSFTAVLVIITVICAVAGVGFKFVQTWALAITISFSVAGGLVISLISLAQIQSSKNKIGTDKQWG